MHESQLSRLMHGDPRYILHPHLKRQIADILEVPQDLIFSADGQRAAASGGDDGVD